MAKDVREWTQTCPQVICAKAGLEVNATLMFIVTSSPFEVVGVNLFSKYALAVPVKDQSANTTARVLYNNLIQVFGCQVRILTDQGPAYESTVIGELYKLYRYEKSRTTAFHPQGSMWAD